VFVSLCDWRAVITRLVIVGRCRWIFRPCKRTCVGFTWHPSCYTCSSKNGLFHIDSCAFMRTYWLSARTTFISFQWPNYTTAFYSFRRAQSRRCSRFRHFVAILVLRDFYPQYKYRYRIINIRKCHYGQRNLFKFVAHEIVYIYIHIYVYTLYPAEQNCIFSKCNLTDWFPYILRDY